MSLTNRLLLFFLAALALVLAGFSSALYLLAREHLHRRAEERLEAMVNTLAAAAEISADGVEWEPQERRVGLPAPDGVAPVWLVSDDAGHVIDRSVLDGTDEFVSMASAQLNSSRRSAKKITWQGGRWLFRQEWLRPDASRPKTPPEPGRKHSTLAITVGTSLEPMRSMLRELMVTLAGLSLSVWLVGLAAGWFVCRWALRPVARMAAAARGMRAESLDRRLPVRTTGDELLDLARSFNGLLDRVQESYERQRRFTGDASHQLRTPLAALLGQVEVALRRERPPEEYRATLAAIQGQAERLRRIVDALLFLARADAEARLPDRTCVDLRDWLPEQGLAWSGHARAADIMTSISSTEPAEADIHPVLLGELLNVLVDNACKYSRLGTPITVSLVGSAGGVELSVTDRGEGIGPDDLDRIFTPFYRGAEARRHGSDGSGLGLAVARRIAEAHGGTLTAQRLKEGGSRFTLLLPTAGPAGDARSCAESYGRK